MRESLLFLMLVINWLVYNFLGNNQFETEEEAEALTTLCKAYRLIKSCLKKDVSLDVKQVEATPIADLLSKDLEDCAASSPCSFTRTLKYSIVWEFSFAIVRKSGCVCRTE